MKYRVKVGLNYRVNGAEHRAEPGDIIELPPATAEWMVADGVLVSEPSRATKAKVDRGSNVSPR